MVRKDNLRGRRRILVVDDDEELLRFVKKSLEHEGFTLATASSGEEAVTKIMKWSPHLVLLDVSMPGLDGIHLLRFLRSSAEYVTTIFLSARSDPQDIVHGLDAGADDYVCKPFVLDELLARIRCHLRIKDIRDELARANAKLQELVEIDDLTGLFNMRSLYQKLGFELERASRYNRSVAVIMMDMDYFKSANDENDHLFGSHVLAQVGQIIRDNMRKVDFAARYGGDEFLIVLTEINLEGARIFAERLRTVIGKTLFKNDQHEQKFTASLGVAVTPAGPKGIAPRALARAADQALYKAKEKGRNCCVVIEYSE